MLKLLWIIFYAITAILIFIFFTNEKKITNKLDEISNKFTDKLKIKEYSNNIIISFNIFIVLFILSMFIFFIDKTRSDIIFLKIYAVYISIIANIVYLILNRNKEYLVLVDFVLFLSADSLFGIYDIYFKYTMLVAGFLIFVSIFVEKNKIKQSIRNLINGIFLIIMISIIQLHYLGNYAIPTQSMEPTILAGDRIFSNNILYKFKSPKLNDIISFEEPLDNKLMYTKRITGVPGTVFSIKNERVYSVKNKISDRRYTSGKVSIYSIINSDIYIPKKGDELVIKAIIEIDFEKGLVEFMPIQKFYEMYKGYDYSKLIGAYNSNDLGISKRYSFLMSAKGHDEILLPILDFKYDNKTFEKLLQGESIILKDNYYMAMGDNTDNSQDSRYFGYVKESRIKGKLFLRWYPINRIGLVKDEY